jgi:hypothetical protein
VRLTPAFCAAIAAMASVVVPACGKKGPPLPPLVKLPAPPSEFTAERRGGHVDLRLLVPSANTDNTRPANLSRIDVYAITSREPQTEDRIVKYGTRVGSVAVKAPRDPDKTIEEDEPESDLEPTEGHGLEQGAVATLTETLTATEVVPVEIPKDRKERRAAQTEESASTGPLLPPRRQPLSRTYVAVGLSTRDRKGPFSKRLAVPLVPPPPPPAAPTVIYDEKAIAVSWEPVGPGATVQPPPSDGELPSTPVGVNPIHIAYNVYDTGAKPEPLKLTRTPTAEPTYTDSRITWGEERCYTIRAVETVGDLTIESDAPAPTCVTLRDTFPPAAPANLQSSPGEGAISLIWDPSAERDLAGYVVLRGDSADTLQPITPAPIQETTFRDEVQVGRRFTYAVIAVDKAGNQSQPSKTVQEAAR